MKHIKIIQKIFKKRERVQMENIQQNESQPVEGVQEEQSILESINDYYARN